MVLKRTGCSNAIAVHAKLRSSWSVVATITNEFEKGKSRLANRIYNVACTSVTSLKLHDVSVALLKYGRYMNKLELSV